MGRILNHFALASTCRGGAVRRQELGRDGSDLALSRKRRGPAPTGTVRAREGTQAARHGGQRRRTRQRGPTLDPLSDSDRRLTDAAEPTSLQALRDTASVVVSARRSKSSTPHRPEIPSIHGRNIERGAIQVRSRDSNSSWRAAPSRTPAPMRTFAHAPDRHRSSARLMRFLCWEGVPGSARCMPTTPNRWNPPQD